MSSSFFYLCAVPASAWHQASNPYGVDIVRFYQDALGSERRIAKEVNLENEFSRYTLACQRLEQEIARSGRIRQVNTFQEFQQTLQSTYFPAQLLNSGYLTLLSGAEDEAPGERIGASFYTPNSVKQHRRHFAEWVERQGLSETAVVRQRLGFLDWIESFNCGLVELQSGFQALTPSEEDNAALYKKHLPQAEALTESEIPEYAPPSVTAQFADTKGEKVRLANALRSQIRGALQSGEVVTFGNQAPHEVITEILHEFVFVPREIPLRQVQLRVAYSDGSEAAPFPLFCLHKPDPTNLPDGTRLRVALMSMRHLELDPHIDFCWFRNREVSRSRTLAETDQFCFETTVRQLDETMQMGNLALQLFHTGFEPAVLGFYRGLVHTLLRLQKRTSQAISVMPYYFRGGENYRAGTIWM